MKIISAKIQSDHIIEIQFSDMPVPLSLNEIRVQGLDIKALKLSGNKGLLKTSSIDIHQDYMLVIDGHSPVPVRPDGIFDAYHSSKPLGCIQENDNFVFRLFAPRARTVQLVVFERYDRPAESTHEMSCDGQGTWECRVPRSDRLGYYCYRLDGRAPTLSVGFSEIDIPDPYSKAVVTTNDYRHRAKTVMLSDDEFDWQEDSWICPKSEELIIYEMHVRDMTAHATSGISKGKRGTYLGLTESGCRGGLDYIRSLGVNAVELQPIHEFANLEVPYKDPFSSMYNTWNPYARNHWGYMTSFYFAPESYYATGQNMDAGMVCGAEGNAVRELKFLVKTFHQAGIAVILDVVYNHVSHYDLNPLKSIDRDYYFKLDDHGHYCSDSGCGNDLNTTRPMVRKLIVDSILYWMQTYHIDGFRFDLAGMIDDETLDAVSEAARKVNPDVILIAEPWGGSHHGQRRFSIRDWSSWNDWYRNGIKGADPVHQKGLLFGQSDAQKAMQQLKHVLQGCHQNQGGQFLKAGHSVNYLESHDGYTLGDFIRIAMGLNDPNRPITREQDHHILSTDQLQIHKLAALILLTGQGAVMLHEGQEFGRSKVIAQTDAPDPDVGRLDHNSYNKDNETNWINYDHADLNAELVKWYTALIKIRREYPHFTVVDETEVQFIQGSHPWSLGMRLSNASYSDMMVLYNVGPAHSAAFQIDGKWKIILQYTTLNDPVVNTIDVPARCGIILKADNSP